MCRSRDCVLLRDLAENITRLLLHYQGLTLDGEGPQGKQNNTHTDETGKTTSDRTCRELFSALQTTRFVKEKKITLYKYT